MDGWLKLGFVEANPNLATESPSDLQIVWIGWCVLKLAGPIDLMDMEKDFVLTFWLCWRMENLAFVTFWWFLTYVKYKYDFHSS